MPTPKFITSLKKRSSRLFDQRRTPPEDTPPRQPSPGQTSSAQNGLKEQSNGTNSSEQHSKPQELEDALKSILTLWNMSRRPLPTQTGDGTYLSEEQQTGILEEIRLAGFKGIKTVTDLAKTTLQREPIDDRTYLMERVIQVRI